VNYGWRRRVPEFLVSLLAECAYNAGMLAGGNDQAWSARPCVCFPIRSSIFTRSYRSPRTKTLTPSVKESRKKNSEPTTSGKNATRKRMARTNLHRLVVMHFPRRIRKINPQRVNRASNNLSRSTRSDIFHDASMNEGASNFFVPRCVTCRIHARQKPGLSLSCC